METRGGTTGSQVGTNGSQVGTKAPQVGAKRSQVGTNTHPKKYNSNVFNVLCFLKQDFLKLAGFAPEFPLELRPTLRSEFGI
ncbi:MAG TPA: hypothetical protein VG759_00460 [Candidatus Angelobacter sp.]|nr:hypothetical protein [Candidatus Angelobacter sp.]